MISITTKLIYSSPLWKLNIYPGVALGHSMVLRWFQGIILPLHTLPNSKSLGARGASTSIRNRNQLKEVIKSEKDNTLLRCLL